MDNIFGVSMNLIMLVLVSLMGLALATVAYVAVRHRIMFMVGVRNIPRRRAQTTLIVLGLMLSTLIISAAFTTGDTVTHSISAEAFDTLGHVDETVIAGEDLDEGGGDNQTILRREAIPLSLAAELTDALAGEDEIDGITPVMFEPVAILNSRAGQSEPLAVLVGVDPGTIEAFPDVIALDGRQVDVGALTDDEVLLNEKLAGELGAVPGDTVDIFLLNERHPFRVAGIVRDRLLTGSPPFADTGGLVTRLDVVAGLFDREGEVDFIAVSNAGGVREGLEHSDSVTRKLKGALVPLGGASLNVDPIKEEAVETAEEFGSFMVTIFVVLGLFSIAAGVLLIFMIFVMLAAERKAEMGISRALGTQRSHLVEMFLAEGMGYNLMAALVGVALGVGVSMAITRVMAILFSEFDVGIEFNVTGRSLLVSYALGVVLTFVTVAFSSWRVSVLNIVRAIRDLPEPPSEGPSWRGRDGMRSILSQVGWLIVKPQDGRAWRRNWVLLGAALAAGVLGAAVLSGGASVLIVVVASAAGGLFALRVGRFATALVVAGAFLMPLGVSSDQLFPYALGFSLVVLGLTLTLNLAGVNQRPIFTAAGVLLLAFWTLGAGGYMPPKGLDGDEEMFFLSGLVMILAATFILVYNADLLLRFLERAGGGMGRILPALKTAVAYPLSSKLRTGMTMAMIGLVVFALVMNSTMTANFNALFLSDDALGGWDVTVRENPNNPLIDLRGALASAPGVDTSTFDAVGRVDHVGGFEAELKEDVDDDFAAYPVSGLDQEFLLQNDIKFQARATGYESDRAVWEALAADPSLAVIDAFSLGGLGFDAGSPDFRVDSVADTAKTFEPVPIQIRDPVTGNVGGATLIGVMAAAPSASFYGFYTGQETVLRIFGPPDLSTYVVRLAADVNAKDTAQAIEAALLERGAQAESIRDHLERDQRLTNGFFWLIQGFMGLGLFVGTAAVGVVAFRTVVERRQQIGMLRAIGYQRGTVGLSFLMESSFIALLGVVSGIGLAILLAFMLLNSDEFSNIGLQSFVVPWSRILLIAGFTYGASLLMSLIPSRQAASIPVAEALRYE